MSRAGAHLRCAPILPNPGTSFPLPTSPSDEPVLAL
jgi:hypothetical protein